MSISDCQSYVSHNDKEVEPALKDLLEKVLLYLEKFIETKEDLQQVESELRDYENLVNLINIIKTVFNTLANKIDLKLIKLNNQIDNDAGSHRSVRTEQEYEKLEQIIQKYEAEIRTHIRIEQQLKLYAESIQSKLEDSEKTRTDLLDSTKAIMNNIKRDNQKLSEVNRHSKEEADSLRIKFDLMDKKYKLLEDENNQLKQKYIIQQQSQVKKFERKFNDNRNGPSFSEHKLIPYYNESLADPSTDYPQQSLVSMKQTLIHQSPQKQQVTDTSHKQSRTNSKTQNIFAEQEAHKVYGMPILNSKNNSIASIKDMMNATLNVRKNSNSGVGSRNVSLNNSALAQKYNQDAFLSQQRSRSQQGNPQQKQPQKQRTETIAKVMEGNNKLWKFK